MSFEIKNTCRSHPSQWSGRTVSGYPFLLHYRFGRLRLWLGIKDAAIKDDVEIIQDGALIFERRIGDDEWDGDIALDAALGHVGNVLQL